jgi:hypothetical protein
MDLQFLVNPWFVSGGFGAVLGVGVLVLIWRSASVLAGWLKTACSKLFTRAGFFWSVISVFMAVSVWQGGAFFSISGDYVGFAVAFFLDLVTVVLMHAQLESRYRGENGRANLFVFFIAVTCGTSGYANLAVALNSFKAATMLPNAPEWVQAAAPFALASSPLFVIMMSIAAEMIVNIRPLDKLKEGEYEADEKKRVTLLEIRNRYYEKQIDAALALQTIKARFRSNRSRGWFLRLPWVRRLDVDLLVSEATKKLDDRFAVLAQQSEQLAQLTTSVQSLQRVDVTAMVVGAIDPLASKVLALAQLNEQVSNQLQGLQGQVKPLDTAVLVREITRQLDTVYAARFEALTRHNEELSMQLSLLMVEVQAFDDAGDTEELETSVRASYPVELANAIESLLSDYPSLQAWLSACQRSATIEQVIEATGHSRKMIVNRINDHTIKRTRKAGKYRVDSVIAWLKTAPLPKSNRVTSGKLEAVKAPSNGHSKDTVKLDEFEPVGV